MSKFDELIELSAIRKQHTVWTARTWLLDECMCRTGSRLEKEMKEKQANTHTRTQLPYMDSKYRAVYV